MEERPFDELLFEQLQNTKTIVQTGNVVVEITSKKNLILNLAYGSFHLVRSVIRHLPWDRENQLRK